MKNLLTMASRLASTGPVMLAFLLARIIEFSVFVIGLTTSELFRAFQQGSFDYFSLKTILFMAVAFYVGFGYLLVSFLAFFILGITKNGVTRQNVLLANVIPLVVWWLISAFYVYGIDVPLSYIVVWAIAIAINAMVASRILWPLADRLAPISVDTRG